MCQGFAAPFPSRPLGRGTSFQTQLREGLKAVAIGGEIGESIGVERLRKVLHEEVAGFQAVIHGYQLAIRSSNPTADGEDPIEHHPLCQSRWPIGKRVRGRPNRLATARGFGRGAPIDLL